MKVHGPLGGHRSDRSAPNQPTPRSAKLSEGDRRQPGGAWQSAKSAAGGLITGGLIARALARNSSLPHAERVSEAELDDAHAVARRLAVLPEPAMRVAALCEQLLAREPEDAAWLLDVLATAGRAGGPPYDVSLLAAIELAGQDRLPYPTRRAIYEAADRLKLESCKELLFTSASPQLDEDAAAPRPLTPGTRPLTLGERKSLARTWKREVLERLLVDPHVDVVELLLRNPRLTETDVLRIATARRASAAVLELVLHAERWNCRPRVRRALLRNPNLPEAAAVRLVGLLNRPELRELGRDHTLPLSVSTAIHRRLHLVQ